MSGSSIIVAVNAVSLKRLRLPDEKVGQDAPPHHTVRSASVGERRAARSDG
jgi:hypothetical protein